MSLLAPGYLVAALAAAAGVVTLHFFARRLPKPFMLPTARFVPEAAVRAPSPTRRPTDLLLLAARVVALVLVGAALARPVPVWARRSVARVIVTDTAGAARAGAVGDSAATWRSEGDSIVGGRKLEVGRELTAALVLARRAGTALAPSADSLELVIVSAFTRQSWDDATAAVRNTWPGRARLVAVTPAAPAPSPAITIAGPPQDPLRATVALMGARRGAPSRVVRGAPSAPDSAWAAAGNVLVDWPAAPAGRWPREGADTIGAVASAHVVVVAPFVRAARLPAGGRVTARWADGEPAAVEWAHGTGCIRAVAVPVPATGDLVLRPSFRALVDRVAAPCGGAGDRAPLDSAAMATLAGPPGLAPGAALAAGAPPRSPLAAWLLAAAALVLIAEMALRRPREAA